MTEFPAAYSYVLPHAMFSRRQRHLLAARPAPELHDLLIAFAGEQIPAEPPDGAVLPNSTGMGVWVRDDAADKNDEAAGSHTALGLYLAGARWLKPGSEGIDTWPVAWFKGALPVVLHTLARCRCSGEDTPPSYHTSHQPGCPWGSHPAPPGIEAVPALAHITVRPSGLDDDPAGSPAYSGPVHAAHEKLETGHWLATDTHGEHAELYVDGEHAAAVYRDEDPA